jgi:putative restriction endonuclease
MFAEAIRLNVGQVETLTLLATDARFLFRAPLVGDLHGFELTRSDRPFYPSVPVPSGVCVVPAAGLPSVPPNLRNAHDAYIEAAATHKKGSPFRSSFSPGVLEYLENLLGAELPRPTWCPRNPVSDPISELTKEDYKRAFLSVGPIQEHHSRMLCTHYQSAEHTITASQLALVMGYATHGGANLQYGQFAERICSALDIHPALHLHILVTDFKPENDSDAHWQLVLRPQVVEALRELGWFKLPEFVSADEVVGKPLLEGAVRQVQVNAYERSAEARDQCLTAHGRSCCICGFNFGAVYGEIAEGYIHVHHLRPLSEIGAEYVVDPVADLRPVCPNCHAVLHLRDQCRSIEEVRELLSKRTESHP